MMTKTLVPTQGGQSGHMTFKAKSQALISIKANEGVWEGLKRSKPREPLRTFMRGFLVVRLHTFIFLF